MKVKELKSWLKDKNDEDDVCELEEYGYVRSLNLSYITTQKNKDDCFCDLKKANNVNSKGFFN